MALTQLLAFFLYVPLILAQPGCRTQTRYNPIAEDYPLNITGVANGTFSLVRIPRTVAASLLPGGLGFINGPKPLGGDANSPLLVRAVHVHDIRASDDMWRGDHTVISFEIPFVDAIGDGKTPFRFVYTQLIRAGTPSYAIDVAKRYGVPHIIPSVFEPECDAYHWVEQFAPDGVSPGNPRVLPMLRAIPADGSMRAITVIAPEQATREGRPFEAGELKQIISQPRFGIGGEGRVCGRTTVFFGEDAGFEKLIQTKGAVRFSGSFESLDILLDDGFQWRERVYGIEVGTAFVDDDFVDCKSLAK